jgi:hypothetical protein
MSETKMFDEGVIDPGAEPDEAYSIEESSDDGTVGTGEIMTNPERPTTPDPETVKFEGTAQHKWSGTSGCSAYIRSAAQQALVKFFNAQVAAHPDLFWSEANYTGGTSSIKKKIANSGKRKCYGYVNVNCYIIFTKKPA